MPVLLPHVIALGKDQLAIVRCKCLFNKISVCWRDIEEYATGDIEGSVLFHCVAVDQGSDEG